MKAVSERIASPAAWIALAGGVGSFVVLFLWPSVKTHRSPGWPTPAWIPFCNAVLFMLPIWLGVALLAQLARPTKIGWWAVGLNGLQLFAIAAVLALRVFLE